MNNCILVCTHPKDYHWTYKLLDSASELENIVIAFSSKEDAKSFNHPFKYKSIITDKIRSKGRLKFVTDKKLNALSKIHVDYDYIAVIDTESKFIKPTTPHLKDIWDKNCLVANHSKTGADNLKEIVRLCGYYLPRDIYIWFNEIPIFKCSLVPDFLRWVSRKKDALENEWAFEYILFAIYCKYELKMSWRMLGTKSERVTYGLVEDGYWQKCSSLVSEVSWSTWFHGVGNHYNILMLFHLDRFPIK